MKSVTRRSINRVYSYAKTANLVQLKKGLIDYILDELYDLSYCKTVFNCNDKDTLIRYIEPLVSMHKTRNDYYRTFNDYPVKEYYHTPLFDDDNRDERIIKTKSQIALNRIKETCYFYGLRYGFDVYSLYQFMDNNRYIRSSSSSDDDFSVDEDYLKPTRKRFVKRDIISKIDNDTIKLTDYNDNLRVIIAPIFPQKRISLELGPVIDLSTIRTVKRLPFNSFNYPLYFDVAVKPFHDKLPFEFKIAETISDGIYVDRTNERIIITGLDLCTIYRCLYGDYLCYSHSLDHVNGSCVATSTDYYMLIDIGCKNINMDNTFIAAINDPLFKEFNDLGLVVYRYPLTSEPLMDSDN
jgi:hypothetical protein